LEVVMKQSTGSSMSPHQKQQQNKKLRILKTMRLLRLLRILRVTSRLEYTMKTKESIRTLYKFFFCVIIICHVNTCLFYAIGVEFVDPLYWANGISQHMGYAQAYIAGFYWSIQTITTVGYGDIAPSGTHQRVYGLFSMLAGALLFGYGVSHVVNVIEDLRSDERRFREELDKFNQYMRSHNVCVHLQEAVRDYLKNVRRVKSQRVSVDDEIAMLSQVSLGLREELAKAVNERFLRDMPFLEGLDPVVVMELVFCMER